MDTERKPWKRARILHWHDVRYPDDKPNFGAFRAFFIAGIVDILLLLAVILLWKLRNW
jgi:hypothetical protein